MLLRQNDAIVQFLVVKRYLGEAISKLLASLVATLQPRCMIFRYRKLEKFPQKLRQVAIQAGDLVRDLKWLSSRGDDDRKQPFYVITLFYGLCAFKWNSNGARS
jgi:hypothetical protein